MLLVYTYLDKSKINGIGLFAKNLIPKGTVVWELVKDFDVIINKSNLEKLPDNAKAFVLHYGYYDSKKKQYIVCLDNARFLNHSKTPNLDETDSKKTIARRDIQPGEELTVDYFEYDSDAKRKLTDF